MDLEAIWQTHKQFLIKVIAGTLTFLVLMGLRNSMANSTALLAKGNTSKELTFQEKKTLLEGAEGREKGRAKALEEKAEPALVDTLTWKTSPGFVVPAGEKSPLLFYASALSKAISDIGRRADKSNARVPRKAGELGLQSEVQEAMVTEALARADLVRGVVIRLLDAGVRELSFVEPGDADYQSRQGDERFLRAQPIRISFVADTALLAKVLSKFQIQGAFLQVRGCRVTRESSKPGSKLVVELDLQALNIVDASPRAVSAPTEHRARHRSGGPRSFGRDR